ncbi:MAG: hypothetical protein ACRDKI_05370 [Solirubrobacterales bacterium]
MGKRSRNRTATQPDADAPVRGSGARARRARLRDRADVASREAERKIKDRPQAPWHPFPLTELSILIGLVLTVIGALTAGQTGKGILAAGIVLLAFGGLETIFREHFTGYRNHAGTITLMAAVLALILTTAVVKMGVAVRAIVLISVFFTVYPTLRRAFIRRSGGQGVL